VEPRGGRNKVAERDVLLCELVAEILGPRGGVREVLKAPPHRAGDSVNPLDEYLTGVLAPREALSTEIDSADNLLGEEDEAADDSSDVGVPAVPPGVTPTTDPGRSPSLDPRSRPCSIGLSVIVRGANPKIEICATWAWYARAGANSWQREPRSSVFSADCTSSQRWEVTNSGDDRKIAIQLRSGRAGDAWRLSLFLINETSTSDSGPEHHVYQPQIRICVCEGTRLVPLDDDASGQDDPEAATLALLYSERRAFARGHLCAAVWKDVDPEREFGADRRLAPPFAWLDGSLLAPAIRERFSPADARTELVPAYLITAPELSGNERVGATILDPERLSELWNSQDIRAALVPLADTYQNWIGQQEAGIARLAPQHRAAAQRHLIQCRESLRRMTDGIDLLSTDEDARIAFCFANKSIALQARWGRGRVAPWRPFQLAFQLLNLPAIRNDSSPERLICDLLWIPTGGGKTEAYLGLAAFTYALRRRLAGNSSHGGAGMGILSRYTLRLLTIQQFRRALSLITASEFLRVMEVRPGIRGWRPKGCPDATKSIWGERRFAIGLWVGGNVTPNGLYDFSFKSTTGRIETVRGALSILRGEQGEGEPAQVLKCPACSSWLAIPPEGLSRSRGHELHFVVECPSPALPAQGTAYSGPPQQPGGEALFDVSSVQVAPHSTTGFYTLSVSFQPRRDVSPEDIDRWCTTLVLPAFGNRSRLVSFRASRPGYFVRWAPMRGGRPKDIDFELFCPNPRCELNSGSTWTELTPAGPLRVNEAFEVRPAESSRIPIPALTVDDQIYHQCPTMVVATVDKFARLAFEPRASSLFGVVDYYCDRHGYYRAGCPPNLGLPSGPSSHPAGVTPIAVSPFPPPALVLQDELHLIEGPLGSMVGIYETAIEALASRVRNGHIIKAKYVASSATVRKAEEQVASLYERRLAQFPPPGSDIDDSFFAVGAETHPLDARAPGRLYVGICAPGRGAQTPIVRIWSRLLQSAEEFRLAGASPTMLDPFWTLVGYFNAIRELAGVVALVRQDIRERIAFLSAAPRLLDEDEPLELSSRADSLKLPGLLEQLGERLGTGGPVGTVVATSMFGTGVDVTRLGLMVVHGQPKTSSSYIQATGRVGRECGGLVVTVYRAARPRDLSHYEFFIGYHRELYRHVEPITVSPFSPRARDRALGPVTVAMLRQAMEIPLLPAGVALQSPWHIQQRIQTGWFCRAADMALQETSPEVTAVPRAMEDRAIRQPIDRRPAAGTVLAEASSEIARWAQLARTAQQTLLYQESSLINPPSSPVVLGDLAHEVLGLPVAFENAPNSLREVEATTTIRGRR
jgi:hypothetical protein